MALAGVAQDQVTAMTIGFVLGPRLNAAGQFGQRNGELRTPSD